MSLSRRHFFIGSSALTAGLIGSTLLSKASTAAVPARPASFDPKDWRSVRAQFRLSPKFVHISNFFLSSYPLPVREAIDRYREALNENPYTFLEDHMFAREKDMIWRKICAVAADYTGGKADEIALTSSTTQGLAMIYNGLPLKADQEILTSNHEWYTHDEAMRLAVQKWGGTLRRIDLYTSPADVSTGKIIARILNAIRPHTRILAMTWVHSGTGVRLPIKAIGNMVAKLNQSRSEEDKIIFVVDGVHGFGCVDEDVADMGCDFFSAGTHKWILGPHGTGIVWGKTKSWKNVIPTIPSIMAPEPANAWRKGTPPPEAVSASWVSPGGFFAYENQWATVEAFEFIKKIGRKRIADRVAELNGQLKEGLSKMPNVTLYTPLDKQFSAGIVCCNVAGHSPKAVVEKLKQQDIIASATPYRESSVRFSAGIINSEEDIEKTLRAMHGFT